MATRVEPYVKVNLVVKDEPTRLAIDGTLNIGCVIVSSVGPKLAYVQGPEQFLANYTVDGQIPRNADITLINAYYMSFFAPMVIVRSINSEVTGGVLLQMSSKNPSELSSVASFFKDGNPLLRKSSFTVAPATAETANYGFLMDDVLYYAGSYEDVIAAIKDANKDAGVDFTSLEAVDITPNADMEVATRFISEVNHEGIYEATLLNSVVTLYYENAEIAPKINKLGEVVINPVGMQAMTVSEQPATTPATSGNLVASICSKIAQSKDFNGYSIKISDSRELKGHIVFDLTLNDGTGDKVFLVSFDKEAVDSSDVNCYIENLNALADLPFEIKVLSEYPYGKAFTSKLKDIAVAFGAGMVSIVESAKLQNMMPALYELEDQERYVVNGLAPLGVTNIQFIKAMAEMGARNKWFLPCDIPYDRTNSSSIAAYGVNLPDSYGCMLLGPFDKNVGLLGWMTYIAASTLYWERVFTNKASNSEFAPVFDSQYGLMNYTNPVKLITKSQRESMLSQPQPINYVIFDQAIASYYMNDNWTHYSLADNVMGEENSVRMAYKIAQDLNQLYKQFKAKHNTMSTRKLVEDLGNLYFKQNIMNQNFKPEEYMVICNRTNNTDEIINSRKLAVTVKVRMYKSTKYITVLEEIYSVGGASFEE